MQQFVSFALSLIKFSLHFLSTQPGASLKLSNSWRCELNERLFNCSEFFILLFIV